MVSFSANEKHPPLPCLVWPNPNMPADRNWFKALATAELLAHALEQLDPKLPEPAPEIEGLRIV